MKKLELVAILLFFAGVSSAAVPEISDVVVRQRWPWNDKVDIDFVVGEGDPCDVEISATYDGCAQPVSLSGAGLTGDLFGAKPGARHLVWDPVQAGLGDRPLTNFKVEVTPISAAERTYLVLDLVDGTYSYLADVPAEGWGDDYKTSKLVFRRIPAATYTLGYPDDIVTMTFPDSGKVSLKNVAKARKVTISSDYYIAVFMTTAAQNQIVGGGSSTSKKPHTGVSYEVIRGAYAEGGAGVDWPVTGFRVADSSTVAKFRNKFREVLPKSWILDLPTAAQWEAAARAGAANTLWYNGGLPTDSADTLRGYLSEIAVWNGAGESNVGTKTANAFGLYDVAGDRCEWLLDLAFKDTSVALGDSTDPVGVSRVNSTGNRLVRGGSYSETTLSSFAIGNPARNEPATATYVGYRFCINLRDWVSGK